MIFNSNIDNFPGDIDHRLRIKEEAYTDDLSTPFTPHIATILKDLSQETKHHFEQLYQFMATETQHKLLHQLIKIFRSHHILEIGSFTGGSTIAMASALPVPSSSSLSSKVVSLEIDEKALDIAKKFTKKAKLEDRIEYILGPALESLHLLASERPKEQYDFVFIDADKGGLMSYYDFIMDHDLLSDDGVIIADNVLFYGQVHRQAGYDVIPSNLEFKRDIPGMAKQVHAFNQHVLKDERVEVVMLPLFDGISIITKKR
ncbi:O-methyltransferase [Phascolomyces articulosus]|uniref:O-methyltransferase n=1 Tax=Phascolomyces articulosus TaxID=60185 RepID=A0AAD5JS34_9FUNG|nr:O-methyltransferase [Phascolomyces articulosus]